MSAATAAFAVSGWLDCPLLTAAARNNLLIAVVAVANRGFLLLAWSIVIHIIDLAKPLCSEVCVEM